MKLDDFMSKTESYYKEREKILQEIEDAKIQISKLNELERERDELVSKAAINEETLSVLKAELVSEKVERIITMKYLTSSRLYSRGNLIKLLSLSPVLGPRTTTQEWPRKVGTETRNILGPGHSYK